MADQTTKISQSALPEDPELAKRLEAYEASAAQCPDCQKIRTPEQRKELLNRLNRIEGQIRGIASMVNRDAYCADILIQVSATSAALNGFTKAVLYDHVSSCVADDLKNGSDKKLNELLWLMSKLLR